GPGRTCSRDTWSGWPLRTLTARSSVPRRGRAWRPAAPASPPAFGSPPPRRPRCARAWTCSAWTPRTDCYPGESRRRMSRLAHPAGPRHADGLPAEHSPIPPADLNALDPAIWPRSARRIDGALIIGGIDVRDLAAQYGTPAFFLDEEDFRGRCREFAQAFGERAAVFYAAKAFCCRGVLRWAAGEGLGVDVCTGGELEVALATGVDPAMITMHGSN